MKNDRYDWWLLGGMFFIFVLQVAIYLLTQKVFSALMAMGSAMGAGFVGGGIFMRSIWGPTYDSLEKLVRGHE